MILDENNQAILLLSAHFSASKRGEPTPLTPTEYGRFSTWLHENQYQPRDLFSRFETVSQGWVDPKKKITAERLNYLLGRGTAMALALEKWNSAGIWIMTRAEADYPERLKAKLGQDAPAVLFGVGNKKLLNAGGLAIVGSRTITDADRSYTKEVAQRASNDAMNVVSGGAKGVDETAMLGALEIEGTALGILANGLMTAALSGKWRAYLKSKQLCLASTYYPEAAFHVGNAMGRNKYIYCLADYGLVVRTDKGEGGTWAGATEALKKQLAPVFVNRESSATGNVALIELGAVPLGRPTEGVAPSDDWLKEALRADERHDAPLASRDAEPVALEQSMSFFDYFVEQLTARLSGSRAITLKELKELHPDLAAKQITDWLGRAVEEGLIERSGKAHRYTLRDGKVEQQQLFDSGEGES
jgi:predicted Rossmann fold nucleotide-binding protein DprA/Smf involved in DNA uptake